jgi:hypothetical protein
MRVKKTWVGGPVGGCRVAGGHPTEAAPTVTALGAIFVAPPCVVSAGARRQAAREQVAQPDVRSRSRSDEYMLTDPVAPDLARSAVVSLPPSHTGPDA